MVMFDRDIFFDSVRDSLFSGGMTQGQVDGMSAILSAWELDPPSGDRRWLAYCLATTYHETSQEMQPIEEYGKGAGMDYGKPDPETDQTYYGRGFVQLTWRDNYRKATAELDLAGDDDLEWHASRALDLQIASDVMFEGMVEGWFRPPNKLSTYFNETVDDPFTAREIINGDKNIVPSWSGGISIGKLVANYHKDFLKALNESWTEEKPLPPPVTEAATIVVSSGTLHIIVKDGATVTLTYEE
jgi:hypothetical protein